MCIEPGGWGEGVSVNATDMLFRFVFKVISKIV